MITVRNLAKYYGTYQDNVRSCAPDTPTRERLGVSPLKPRQRGYAPLNPWGKEKDGALPQTPQTFYKKFDQKFLIGWQGR